LNKINNRTKVFICLFMASAFVIGVIGGCGSTKKQGKYTLDASLLGPAFEIPTTGKVLQLPASFVPLVDSELVSAKEYVRQMLGDNMGMLLQQIYHNDSAQSTIWIYAIGNLNTSQDTSGFVNYYKQGLLSAFGDSNVKIDNFYADGIIVKEYIVKDTERGYMKIHIIGISKTKNGVILEYNAPFAKFDEFKKQFESSIASIKEVK
jgi:hypothetical protein